MNAPLPEAVTRNPEQEALLIHSRLCQARALARTVNIEFGERQIPNGDGEAREAYLADMDRLSWLVYLLEEHLLSIERQAENHWDGLRHAAPTGART